MIFQANSYHQIGEQYKVYCIFAYIMGTKDQLLLQRIKSSVVATSPDAKLVLFGSYARGTNTKESDIDLLILLDNDKITWPEEKRVTYPLYDIEFETGTRISPVVLSKKDWELRHKITPFYKNVAREGIVL
jgi:predicted nucleotidyltransferase